MNIIEYFKKKGILSILSIAFGFVACVCALVGLILYVNEGVTNFTSDKLDSAIIVMSVIGMVLSVATLVSDFILERFAGYFKLGKYAAFIVYLVALLQFIVFEVDYIGSIFVGIDNTVLTAPFVVTLVMFIIATIFSLVSAILKKDPFEETQPKGAQTQEEADA